MTLTEFLKARLNEDEQTAREAGNRRWLVEDNAISLWPEDEHDGFMTWPTRADARHAYRWQPERVLAEVDAKRRIMDEHTTVVLRGGPGARYYETTRACRSCEPPKQFPETAVPCRTLRLLALPYAGHPDYDPAWRP